MSDSSDQLKNLLDGLESLEKNQVALSRDIIRLKLEINKYKNLERERSMLIEDSDVPSAVEYVAPTTADVIEYTDDAISEDVTLRTDINTVSNVNTDLNEVSVPKSKSNLEKFIGENLINKIGIAIIVIGVGIGAKYSIDNDLISPLTRIILGYMFGLGLMGFGIKLKKDYHNFSAVLVSGAMTIMYFITYFAYSLYGLMPQGVTFALMVIFTVFTVIAALNYNKQIIALIGLAGAYAVPFLLSDGSGNVLFLFTYIAIINIGILSLAFKKNWKPLYFASFGMTWLIFISWYVAKYQEIQHFSIALIYLAIYFVIFYIMFLVYHLLRKERFGLIDIFLLLANSFLFYGLGFLILQFHETGSQLLGIFTLVNAAVHFAVGSVIHRQQLADKNLFYLVFGLVLVFITIAIPVQLDGNWVTLLWAGEAALLFWIGRTKGVGIYENMSYPLMVLAFLSLCTDWSVGYGNFISSIPSSRLTPIFNTNFLTSILFILALGFIAYIDRNNKNSVVKESTSHINSLFSGIISVVLIFTVYNAFRLEIANYWDQLYEASSITIKAQNENESASYFSNYDLLNFKNIWLLNYTMFFLILLMVLNNVKWKYRILGFINLGLLALIVFGFLTEGLYVLSELRASYLNQHLAEYYEIGTMHLYIRYISFLFVILAMYAAFRSIRQSFLDWDFTMIFDLFLSLVIVWIASSEWIHWLDLGQSEQSYKLGLSILWGVSSLILIAVGIWQKKSHLRIGAIVLFGATLLKLFFYDIIHLDTISKTIVFVSLGILLLVISFLYNKYKNKIGTDDEV